MPVLREMTRLAIERRDAPKEQRLLAVLAPAADDIVTLVEFAQDSFDILRVILQVGVNRDDNLAPRRVEAGRHRRRLAEIAAKMYDMPAAVARLHGVEQVKAAVLAAVIDGDDLVVAPDFFQRLA